MDTIRFRATTSDGRTITGPIRGNGGMLGSGALHAGPDIAKPAAENRIRAIQRIYAKGRPLPIFEPSPGCVAMYPDFCAAYDGERVDVPVRGTLFEVV